MIQVLFALLLSMSIQVDGSTLAETLDPSEWEYVRINFDKLNTLAGELAASNSLKKADWREILPVGLGMKELVEYVMGLISIDFCHWDLKEQSGKTIVRNFYTKDELGVLLRGSAAMAYLAKKAYQNGVKLFDADFMKHMTVDILRPHFIGFDCDENVMEIPWLADRVKVLNEVGEILLKKWNGSFCNILIEAKRRAFNQGNGFVEILINDFPRFKDEYIYKNKKIGIHKLAQLSVIALQSTLSSYYKFPLFEDFNALTLCADYQLPRALRALGVLEYKAELSNYVDQEIPLVPGSSMEIELRMATICVGEHLKQISNAVLTKENRPLITSQELDFFLWSYGRQLDRNVHKHHLSITTMY